VKNLKKPKHARLPIAALTATFVSLAAAGEGKDEPSHDSDEFPIYVMNKIDDQHRGAKSHGVMQMKVKTKHWTREMSLESWSLGKSYSLVRILEPKKEKGNATLKANNDFFTYLSKTGRTVKITSGMMGGSWMGSHFTNDDLIRHTRLSEDYDIELAFEGEAGGEDICRFELTPKPDAPVVWGKVEISVRQSDLQPISQGAPSRVLGSQKSGRPDNAVKDAHETPGRIRRVHRSDVERDRFLRKLG
jgi:hypothetical protein